MTEQRKKLIEQFQRWLDTNPNKAIIAAQCANIAEQYHKEQLMLADVDGRSRHLLCSCDNPNWLKEMEEGKETCSQCQKPY
jgi:hypothetical protein